MHQSVEPLPLFGGRAGRPQELQQALTGDTQIELVLDNDLEEPIHVTAVALVAVVPLQAFG